jgi:hypothetical protein
MSLAIQNTSGIQQPWTHWFLYGETGSGKTVAAATFPDPLFLVPANEGSELSLRERGVDYIKVGKDADGSPIKARRHMSEILSMLEDRHAKMRAAYAANDDAAAMEAFPWQTIVWESLTHYCDLLVEDISNGGAQKMDQQRWGLLSGHLRTVHGRLRNLDVHVVMTSLAKTENDGASGAAMGKPHIVGSMAEKLPSSCDVIGYCEEGPTTKNGRQWHVHFAKHKWFPARSRFRGLPAKATNFRFADVQQHLGL